VRHIIYSVNAFKPQQVEVLQRPTYVDLAAISCWVTFTRRRVAAGTEALLFVVVAAVGFLIFG
jgi:hypothetical protein